MPNISQYLQFARIGQYEEAAQNRKDRVFKGGVLVPGYARLLYVLQTQIGKRFALAPNDPTLTATSEYMYSLSGGRLINTTPIATPFIILVQPISQTVNSGANVSFIVIVTGGVSPYQYQWYKNGGLLSGQTNQTLSLTSVTSGSAGNYNVTITDSRGVVLTSNNALLLVVTPPITASWYWNADTDPYPALASGTDNLTYLGSVTFSHLSPIIIPWPVESANNTYKVVKYPIGEGNKTAFVNTLLNSGPIPGTAYHEIVTIGSFLYIISRGDSIFTPYTVTYT